MRGLFVNHIARFLMAGAIAASLAVAAILACGPDLQDMATVTAIDPSEPARFARGDLDVVRPRFRRRHLLEAYRVFTGQAPLRELPPRTSEPATSPVDEWFTIAGGRPDDFSLDRRVSPDFFQSILNCTNGAFTQAIQTYRDRVARFGGTSREVADWLTGQKAVFANCDREAWLPDPVPSGLDPIIRADRAYQTAAAHFYRFNYAEAEQRFRAIGADPQSPWRPYGRFLAARALIRAATTAESLDRGRLRKAADDLQAVLADPSAARLHPSAHDLLGFVDARIRPVERLHELTATLTRAPVVNRQDVVDYVWLMDHLVGDTVEYALPNAHDEMAAGDDFTAWVLAMQATAPDIDRALAAWRRTRSPQWLVAMLWRMPAGHAAAMELLQAAAAVPRSSPAFATIAFLRTRELIRQGRLDEARALLATVPDKPDATFSVESVNLVKGQRLRLARSLDEFLSNAPREIVVTDVGSPNPANPPPAREAVFDYDAGFILTRRVPLETLVASAESRLLPERLRRRVAAAAFSRAVVLQDDALGARAAVALAALAPGLRADLQRYRNASDPVARHRAGLLVLLRTPGLHTYVRGLDDNFTLGRNEPERSFDHLFRENWWCSRERETGYGPLARTEFASLLYEGADPAAPAFLTGDQRTASDEEAKRLTAAGSGRAYLAAEALAWARAEPRNPDVAEALAQVVEGWRWGCGDDGQWMLARDAFNTLHRNFPQSEWAKRTRYWYRN